MKNIALMLAPALGCVGVLAGSGIAHADPITDAGDDGQQVTCKMLGERLDGSIADDSNTLILIGTAIAAAYHLDMPSAAQVIRYQVFNYCPQYWQNLIAVGEAANAKSGPVI